MIADFFAQSLKSAVAGELGVAELLGAAERLAQAGERTLATELYRAWVQHNTANPLLYAVYFNHGVVLTDSGDLEGAKNAFLEAIRINPDFPPPYINLGSVLERLGAVGEAVQQWTAIANALGTVNGDSIFHRTTALKQIGRVLETGRIEANAEEALRMSLDIDPEQRDVAQHWIALRQTQCKWPVIEPWAHASRRALMRGMSPLSLGSYSDDPIFQLASANHYYRHDVADFDAIGTAGGWATPEEPRARPLRIGYVSSDLREHAVGFLTSEIYELHDREKVEVFAYYCGIPGEDATKARIRSGVDHWCDIASMSDKEAARRIVDDGIDILVDLNGYTKDARTKLFALRPTPVIINWLGYPGSMATPHHNYIIADEFIVPAGSEIYYAEKVLRLPCYQPNDRKRVIGRTPTRAEAGLPDDAFVFCCFNGMQKVSRFTFDRWMEILRGVPRGVLWLLTGSDETNERLLQRAEQQGVPRSRIVFAPKRANPDHLARYPLADLFLDTTPYGAHTTASDALWLGVPVLTAPGRSFPSRVCGSLVKAAGLEETICASPEEYVSRAIQLGTDGDLIGALKAKLAEKRENCALFDTGLLVSSLEQLYAQAWRDYITGNLPSPDLANLEVYHEIGCDLDHEGMEFQRLADYQGLYRRQLAARHALYPVPADHRLWGLPGPADHEPAELQVGPPAGERQANGNAVNVAALTQQQLH
jgi:predicted O-linked N-acetylglucosamine transferase (SPINDLY family)